ncbi:MAG: phosphatidate cytidylyltransferase [Clostridia bacterium]|jgi:phosphatidate cytidylyltransferase|nr:phosphatidate cytidylyltransferase [Clostridia bacterium]MBR6299676.1 phosphatidate cytidylyltransferase [Clostridia bacterium]
MKKSMKTRIITGSILILALAFAIYVGGWICSTICIIAIGIAQYEMIRALRDHGHQVVRWPIWAATIASIPVFMVYDNRMLLVILVATTIITTAYVLFHKEPKLDDILVTLMPLFAVSLPGMCLLAQINAPYRWLQVMLLCTTFLVPTIGDAAAYFIGSRFGKTKLIPAVSPNKTVAGAVAGLVGSEITALVIWWIVYATTGGASNPALPPLWHFAVIGLVGGVVGQIGDLFASLVKRHCGVKDYGTIFPGHGGMMDRLDSVLFVALLVYMYQSIMW